jgi:retron-type reverse transcriptase
VLNLPSLLIELRGLLVDPRKNFQEIVKQIKAHDRLAEIEVARHYVARAVQPFVEELLRSPDERERQQGVKMAGVAFGRGLLAQTMRYHVMDRSTTVRGNARAVIYRLGLDDVALPANRFRRPGRRDPRSGVVGPDQPAPWNTSGWFYGARRVPTRYEQSRAARKITLRDRGLPAIADVTALAQLVGVEPDALPALMRPGTATGSSYIEFTIPKAKGGTRTIAAPRPALREVQREILRQILDKVPAHEHAHGFVRKRSTVSNARPHEGSALVVKLDLRDFFPSIHFRRVLGLFTQLGYAHEVSVALAGLTTYRPIVAGERMISPGILPQGAPTSPALANLVARRLDERLGGLAKKVGATYTRYADDLTFSFAARPENLGRFFWWVDQIAQQEGFVERADKRRVLGRGNQQRVTGVVVNQGLHVPRELRAEPPAELHQLRKAGTKPDDETAARIRGFAAYVKMVEPARGAKLVAEVEAILGR